MVLKVDDLPLGADGAAIHYDREIVGLACEKKIAGLNLHPTKADVCGLSDPQFVEKDEGNWAAHLKTCMFAFLFPPLSHRLLPAERSLPNRRFCMLSHDTTRKFPDWEA